MTITVAVINQKGGVGKTTTAVNLSACLGNLGHRTLLIDADPQSNTSISYGFLPKDLDTSFYSFLISGDKFENVVKKTIVENLDILPTTADLYAADLDLVQLDGHNYDILKSRLEEVKKIQEKKPNKYEFIIIDSPPHLGPLTLNLMKASDTIIVPLKADFLALQGLAILYKTFNKIKNKWNNKLTILGILLTMYSSTLNICKDVETNVKNSFQSLVFENKIPQNVTIAESPSYSVPVTIHGPKSVGALSYMNFTMEFLRKIHKVK
ncbi:MAG: ParA family protein [Deltaproteobacteria bacterium]|jgi:chromosome partitioning protein|nr:ParA family protein [Deltaproteobacteria bacterium]